MGVKRNRLKRRREEISEGECGGTTPQSLPSEASAVFAALRLFLNRHLARAEALGAAVVGADDQGSFVVKA